MTTTTIAPRLSFETILDGSRSCPTLYWEAKDFSLPSTYKSIPVSVWHYANPKKDGVTQYSFRLEMETEGVWNDQFYRLILRTNSTCNKVNYSDVEWNLGLFARARNEHLTIQNIQKYAQFALESILNNDGSLGGIPNCEPWE